MSRPLRQPRFSLLLGSFLLFASIVWIFDAYIEHKALTSSDLFCLPAIAGAREYRSEWETHRLTPEEQADLERALGQGYHYLACGQQAFAFLSEDGKYVLKFLRQKLFKTPRFWDFKKQWERRNKLERDFASYRLAFDELQQETGLVFVHLNPSSDLPSLLTVVDGQGRAHSLNPNALNFILQRRAELVYPTIDCLMEKGAKSEAQQALHSLLELLAHRVQKGITDSDPDLDKNFGYIGGQAVQIDVGRFASRPQITHYRDRHKIAAAAFAKVEFPPIKESFWEWLSTCHPELYDDFRKDYAVMSREVIFSP